MFFWFVNSAVALLFLGLMAAGIWQRLWMFALTNFAGMVLAALVVLLDILGYFDITTLFAAVLALAFVFIADAMIVFRDWDSDEALPVQPRPAQLTGKYLFTSAGRQEYLVISDEKCLERELNHDTPRSSKDRADALALWKQGNEAFLQRDYQGAATKYSLSAKLVPTPTALSNLTGVLIAMSHAEAALSYGEAACVLDPEHHEAWLNRGSALLLLGRCDEALACFDKATTLQPNTLEPWIYRGNALRKLRQFRQAIECYDTALRINPGRPECWYEKALALTKLNELEEAGKCFDRALEIDPGHVHAWLNRGLVMDKLGRFEEATNNYRHFLRLAPPEMKQHLVRIRSRLLQIEKNRHGETGGVDLSQLELAF